jgi:hypothetical protein
MDGPSESIYRDRGRGMSEQTGGRCGRHGGGSAGGGHHWFVGEVCARATTVDVGVAVER